MLLVQASGVVAEETGPGVLFREDFSGGLSAWEPLTFPKIDRHTIYTTATVDGRQVLQAASDASASGLIHTTEFDVYRYPKVRWSWRVDTLYAKGDARSKAGDDYPLRIYVAFAYDPDSATFWEKIQYNSAKLLYGDYPPHSSLNYIWANKVYSETSMVNSFTDRAVMILKEMGPEHLGVFREAEADILADYQRAFGRKPPPRARIAIMNDSDNTGEKAVSYLDFIEVSGDAQGH